MNPQNTCTAILLLVCIASAVQSIPIKSSLERGLNSRLNHLSGPGSKREFNFDDYLVRNVRKDASSGSGSSSMNPFAPYLMFKTRPPVDLTLQKHSNYVLECEVSGTPKPRIYWEKNGVRIPQGPNVYDEANLYGDLSLSLVKSRLFLDCLTEELAVYACVATNEGPERVEIKSETRLIIQQNSVVADPEAEAFGGAAANSVDFGAKGISAGSVYDIDSALTGCVAKKSFGAPARIYFWTLTSLENIGTNGVLHCRATGFPAPAITWYGVNDLEIVPDSRKYELLATGDLLIRNITFDDMGKYRCAASNKHGSDSIEKIFFYPTEPVTSDSDK